MASVARKFDCIIFGGGLAGTLLSWTFIKNGKKPLLVNKAGLSNCSQVAAGLMNPIGGRRINLVWEAENQIPFAIETYRNLARQFETNFFYPRSIMRLLGDPESQSIWRTKSNLKAYRHWILDHLSFPKPKLPFLTDSFFGIKGGGYLDIPNLLSQLHTDLQNRGNLISDQFDYSSIAIDSNGVSWKSIQAPIAIFADGWLANKNPWLSFIPFRPAKGVIGKIKTNADFRDTAIVDRFFLLPRNDGSIHVGATYTWDELDEVPDSNSITELESFLNNRLPNDWKWIEVGAGIRPSIPGAKPVVGSHPEEDSVFVFNGFGSKGATQIPLLAQGLHDSIWNGSPLPEESSPYRFWKAQPKTSKRWIAVEIARDYLLERLNPGDTAIDATTGNGHDTQWLANAVGPNGHVYAFDIQKQAIDSTRTRLAKSDCSNWVTLVQDCHTRVQENIPKDAKAKAIVFNLGYLPKGEKSVVTETGTTIQALHSSLSLLSSGGILSIVAYPGHVGGYEETQALRNWYVNVDSKGFHKQSISNPSGNPNSPLVFFLTKKD